VSAEWSVCLSSGLCVCRVACVSAEWPVCLPLCTPLHRYCCERIKGIRRRILEDNNVQSLRRENLKSQMKQSLYRPGQALSVPGG
jgi:hypothetical protein